MLFVGVMVCVALLLMCVVLWSCRVAVLSCCCFVVLLLGCVDVCC